MTPIDFARNLARDPDTTPLAVAIIVRGLTDDDPTRQGWPLNEATVERAARYLDLTPTAELTAAALALAPTVSDVMLNRRPA
jgi:hypothetical protein